jgi:hypothetical protein
MKLAFSFVGEEVFMNEGSIGKNFNRLMDSIGFPNELGTVMGAALEARVENNVGVARNLFDAFSSISTQSIDTLMAGAFGPASQILRPHDNYQHHFALHHHSHYERKLPHHCIEYVGRAHQNVAAMLSRCMNSTAQQNILQSLANAIQKSLPAFNGAVILNNAKLNFDQKLSELVQGSARLSLDEILIKLEQILERGTIQTPPPRKKKKKGGLGSKLKKGFKGIKKSVSKVGNFAKSISKNLLKGTMKILTGGFLKSSILQKLLTQQFGPLFKFGSGILGGILGGPVGPAMIAQFAAGKLKPKDLLKAANPLNQMKMFVNPKQIVSFGMDQAFGQVTGMFQVANQYSTAMMDVQKLAYSRLLRG